MVQLSHPYMTIGKTIALSRQTFVDKVMSLLSNMLSRLVIAFFQGEASFNFMAAITVCNDFGVQANKKPFPSPGDLPNTGLKPRSPALQADSLLSEPLGKYLGRKAMTTLHSILKSGNITLPTKIRIVKGMVFPVVMYGCESWTIKKAERRRTDAFKLC